MSSGVGLREMLVLGVLCLVPLVIAAAIAVIAIIYARKRRAPGGPQGGEPLALDILKARYAQGEITREQFDAMRKDLE